MLEELVFAGFGGQGILSAGSILAHAALNEGYEVAWIPSYGPEMRGGTANCNVIVSDEQIGATSIAHPSGAIVMNTPSFERFEPTIRPGGTLVVNSSLIDTRSRRTDIQVLYVATADLAAGAGSLVVASVAALGALNAARRLVPPDRIEEAIVAMLSDKRPHLVSINMDALQAGAIAGHTALATA
ncbi:MAG: 2-oxoacid:acceptor oxidoreductase family protein [Candidatus Sericytochromatia bacterium]|nr:2-oxoacid:acceptor oxidoreductase family protein [Candidatus Tanganyikabacteria bacterium]